MNITITSSRNRPSPMKRAKSAFAAYQAQPTIDRATFHAVNKHGNLLRKDMTKLSIRTKQMMGVL